MCTKQDNKMKKRSRAATGFSAAIHVQKLSQQKQKQRAETTTSSPSAKIVSRDYQNRKESSALK